MTGRSIYRPKDPTVAAESDVRYGAHVDTEARVPQGEPSGDESPWAGRRKAQPVNVLLPATRRWLESLPPDYCPKAMSEQFPRLANLLAANWNNPKDCSAFIYSLLHDQRGGRRGFPAAVMQDIVNLRVCYARLHPIVDWEDDAEAHRFHDRWNPSSPRD